VGRNAVTIKIEGEFVFMLEGRDLLAKMCRQRRLEAESTFMDKGQLPHE